MAKFITTKEYSNIAPVAYRQWRADSHCKYLHGYSLSFKFEFECDELDELIPIVRELINYIESHPKVSIIFY